MVFARTHDNRNFHAGNGSLAATIAGFAIVRLFGPGMDFDKGHLEPDTDGVAGEMIAYSPAAIGSVTAWIWALFDYCG